MLKVNEIYHGDCLEVMNDIDDNSIDLIITSPPYNLGNTHHTNKKRHTPYNDDMEESKYQQWQIIILKEFYRILKENGSLIYNHKNRIKNGKQITPYQWLLQTNFIIKQELIWQNGTPNMDKIRFFPTTERIYWLAKNKKTQLFNIFNRTDLFTKQPVGTNEQHTRAFPIDLVQEFLQCFKSAKIVCDPFAGSGTVGVACINLNRRFILIEKEEKYYNIARERLANTPLPLIVEGE